MGRAVRCDTSNYLSNSYCITPAAILQQGIFMPFYTFQSHSVATKTLKVAKLGAFLKNFSEK